MRRWNTRGYETCVHSMKKSSAPWKIRDSCESPHRLFTGKRFELPNKTVCVHCRFYRSDERTP